MAATVTVLGRNASHGGTVTTYGTIGMDSSYPTGGEAVSANQLGLGKALLVHVLPSGGYVPEYDLANSKVLVYWVDTTTDGAPLAQVASTTDLAAVTFNFLATGRP